MVSTAADAIGKRRTKAGASPPRAHPFLPRALHTERGFFSTLNRLHRAANTGPVWVGIIDAFSGALVVFSVTGLLLWSRLTGPRLLAIGLAGSMLLATVYYAAIL